MRIAILTGRRLYHLHFCTELAKHSNVVCVLQQSSRSLVSRLRSTHAYIRREGLWRFFANRGTDIPLFPSAWNRADALRRASREAFSAVNRTHLEKLAERSIEFPDLNCRAASQVIRDCGVDVVIGFGGPIYGEATLCSAKHVLNYHTGISPVYNGADSIYWAYANGDILSKLRYLDCLTGPSPVQTRRDS